MKDKIIHKATEMFLKLGFKSVTMDDIASEISISKKTIYKYFDNKELLIEESVHAIQIKISEMIEKITTKDFNAIKENFEIRRMFDEMFKTTDTSPVYQLKKHYPEIHQSVLKYQLNMCQTCFRNNIEKGIAEGLYRKELNIEAYVNFYYALIYAINENTKSEREAFALEMHALEYHIRAMATAKGIAELETNLLNPIT